MEVLRDWPGPVEPGISWRFISGGGTGVLGLLLNSVNVFPVGVLHGGHVTRALCGSWLLVLGAGAVMVGVVRARRRSATVAGVMRLAPLVLCVASASHSTSS